MTNQSDYQTASSSSVSVQHWWDSAHRSNCTPDLQGYLTGSAGLEVWQRLLVEQFIRPATRVLNIGVGLGHCTKALAERGCLVSALDVSEVALQKVRSICQNCYAAKDIGTLPSNYFDIAISHLVTQHISNQSLVDQLREVLRSLTPDGIFAMQFADLYGKSRFDFPNESENSLKHGGVCRSLGFMEKLVFEAGGDITLAYRCGIFPQYGSSWYSIHISRRK
jgi:2-polyprenyl-3-methyl-5-hydroxy-6-metoxy-1,4-benzoquinol methylase